MFDAVIISDLHLGSFVCQAELIVAFLSKIKSGEMLTKRLILNGDVFDSWDFTRISKAHWKVLSTIRKLSDYVDVVWVVGNHDGPAEIVSHLLGVNVVDEYAFESGKKKVLVLHGDRFDNFLTDHPLITRIADFFYGIIQRIDKSFWMAKKAKNTSKTFLRCAEQVRKSALQYAHSNHCDLVCCGHTHLAESNHEAGYFNSGCWTETPCHYLFVKNGCVGLCSTK